MDTTARDRQSRRDTPSENRLNVALVINDLAYIKQKIDMMCIADVDQDIRLTKIERLAWAVTVAVSVLAAIFIPIVVAAVKKWLELP